ncbi:MAG: hypothetical protein ACR2P2_20180 [Nakamurella sp.]
MMHATDPSFAYGWARQRNPRTFAGAGSKGRTVLVTVDGRQPTVRCRHSPVGSAAFDQRAEKITGGVDAASPAPRSAQ